MTMTPSCLLQCPRLLYVLCDLHLSMTYFLQPCTIFSLCCRCCRCSRGMLRLLHAPPASGAHFFLQLRHSLTHLAGTALFTYSVYCNLYGCCSTAVLYLLSVRRQALLLLLDPCYTHILHFRFWPLPVVAPGPASTSCLLFVASFL